MKFYAINGSPRKKNNTAAMLQAGLDGVTSVLGSSATTEIIHLYDLDFKACISCFECKKIGGKSYGKCVLKDPLTPVLEKLANADGILFGSPIYYSSPTAKIRMLFERLLFQYTTYDAHYTSLAPKKMPTAFFYTMNVTAEVMEQMNYKAACKDLEFFIGHVFTPPHIVYANNTYQFDDYSKYVSSCFSPEEKAQHKATQFPLDCQKAFEVGAHMAGKQ